MTREGEALSSEDRSFRMDRRSPQASRLRTAVSKKLLDFLGDYSDDVLAEYIVVLVCNGKSHNQARNDLEAFLGEESGKFVAWLWDYLSEEIYMSKVPLGSSNNIVDMTDSHEDDINRNQEPVALPLLAAKASNIPLSMDERYEPTVLPNSNILNTVGVLEGLQHHYESALISQVNSKRSLLQTLETHKKSASTDDYCIGAPNFRSSTMNHHSDNVVGGEQYQKIAKSNSGEPPCQAVLMPMKEPVSRNPQMFTREDPQYRPLSLTSADGRKLPLITRDAESQHINQPRGNVWDRLGTPCTEDDTLLTEKKSPHGLDIVKRKKLEHNEFPNPRLMWVVPSAKLSRSSLGESTAVDSNPGKVASGRLSEECRMYNHNVQRGTLDEAYSFKQKGLFIDLDSRDSSLSLPMSKGNHSQCKEPFQKVQKASSLNYRSMQNSNEVTLGDKMSSMLPSEAKCHSVKSATTDPNPQANKTSQAQLKRKVQVTTTVEKLVPICNSMSAESKSVGNTKSESASHRPTQDEVLDVKLRLHQIEREMVKLRSKQAEISNEAKLNASSGAQNHLEEDIDSRTILVTNVHYAASKEALSSHFTKCGVVVTVTLLIDTITTQPKGAAYIVFASKESVDKAVMLSGTSFFSRILTVMRKADTPPGFLTPAQPAPKLLQPWCSQPYKKGSLQRHHLQWRRDQSAGVENLSTATHSLDALNTGE